MNTSNITKEQLGFTINCLKQINKNNEESFIFSPISILITLVMILFGSSNDTHLQIKNAISSYDDVAIIYKYYSDVHQRLQIDDPFISLASFNKPFISSNYEIQDTYEEFLQDYFNDTIEKISFQEIPSIVEKINNLVTNTTNGNIRRVIEANDIKIDMKFILINALYFKGDWHTKFLDTETRMEKFYVTSDENRDVYLMALENKFYYHENDLFQIVSLPYLGKNINMVIILPKVKLNNDKLLENDLNKDILLDSLEMMEKVFVKVMIPKFNLENTIDIKSILKSFGVTDAFIDGKADFNGIVKNTSLYVSEIKQKAKIEVSEEGTEAAAITVIKLSLYSGSSVNNGTVKEFKANHPFTFYIMDTNYNIYFTGIYK
uniref:SERPIN domain-containing protein n=1 Tax=Parastrongyloides trichosuri TaxID=131310 RepID=A0A0N4ZDV6_PARTI